MAGKRIRRTPDEARRVILDAAEESMAAVGPAGIRLQDVARAAGVSHPTILHHFGNREGLIQALNRRTLDDLKATLLKVMTASRSDTEDGISPTFAAYRNGLAQRVIWLLQSPSQQNVGGLPMFEEIVETLHALRVQIAAPGMPVDKFDSRSIVHLTTIAAFGDAVIGPRLRQSSGAEEQAARLRFEKWLAALLGGYIEAAAARPVSPDGRDDAG